MLSSRFALGLVPCAVLFCGGAAQAAITSHVTTENAVVRDYTGSGTFTEIQNPPSNQLSIRRFNPPVPGGIPVDERSLLEFNTQSLAGNDVTSAQFIFYQVGHTTDSTLVNIYGFTDNGSLTLADATTSGVLLGSYSPVAEENGPAFINLDPAALESLITSNQYVTLRLEGVATTNAQIAKLNSGFSPNPTLQINSAPVPEPTAAVLGLIGGLGLMARRRRA